MFAINSIQNNFYTNKLKTISSQLSFRGQKTDTFEKSRNIKMYNPYEDCYCDTTMPEDLTKSAKIRLSSKNPLVLDYNPKRFDYLVDKQNGEKIKTMILKADPSPIKTSYHFLSEKLDKEFGYVSFVKCKDPKFFDYAFRELLEDKPDEGLEGGRLIVDYLQNFDDEHIGGIGKLGDKLAVKCCIDNILPFNIISVADRNSHAAHFIRGKRYFSVNQSEDPYRYNYLLENFGKTDINQILKELIENNKTAGKKITPNIGFVTMYMPQNLIMKCINELKIHPIF